MFDENTRKYFLKISKINGLTSTAQGILIYLIGCNGSLRTSINQFSKILGVSTRSIIRANNILLEKNLISIDDNRNYKYYQLKSLEELGGNGDVQKSESEMDEISQRVMNRILNR